MAPSRREFIGGLVAGGALAGAAPELLKGAEGAGAGETYTACIIGHTGRGDYGHGLDLAFQKVAGVRVAAVADPDEKGRKETAQKSGAPRSYADWREMLEKEKPNLVAIGPRWVEKRLEMISAAARIGAHVVMEKPMAASLEEADAILDVTAKAKTKIALAFHVRVAPTIVHLKKLLDEGFLGDLLEMRTRGKEDHRAGGEDMAVLGTHCMYLMRYFAGEPIWCSARVSEKGREIAAGDRRAATEPLGPVAGDTIDATFAFAGGVVGHFASHKILQGSGGRFTIALHGSKGVAIAHIGADPEIFHLPDPLWSPGKSGARWQPLPGAPSNKDPSGLADFAAANKRLVEGLIHAVETGGESVASAAEGRAVLEMIFAVYAAHLKGGRVAFPLGERRHPLGTLG